MIVFTNGCFDILHAGHVQYLEQSRALGTKLIVGLNSDASVRKLKGPGRPINSQEDRKVVLEALRCVDEVVIFDESTPYELIAALRPDIITKGGDYIPAEVVGKDLAKVVVLPYAKNKSTTRIIENASRTKRLGSRADMGSKERLLRQEPSLQSWLQIFNALSRGQG